MVKVIEGTGGVTRFIPDPKLPSTIHGHPVLAWAQTEVQSDCKRCGIVLVLTRVDELVTAWYREGDAEWCHGHYFHARNDPAFVERAWADFVERVARNGGVK